MNIATLAIPLILTLAAGEAPQAGPEVLEFSVRGLACGSCAATARAELAKISGVLDATVGFPDGDARLRTDGRVTPDGVRQALSEAGFEAWFPGDPPSDSDPLPESVRARLDLATVSHGERVRLKRHLAPGKLTIIEYYADWCGPCRLLGPKLERLVLSHENVALRRIDVSDWESAAARQATREFGLPGLPYTRVFDERGRLLGGVHGNDMEAIVQLLAPTASPRAPSATGTDAMEPE